MINHEQPLRLGSVSRLPSPASSAGSVRPDGPQLRPRDAGPTPDDRERAETSRDGLSPAAPTGSGRSPSRRVHVVASALIVTFASAWISSWRSPPAAGARGDETPRDVATGPPAAPAVVAPTEVEIAEQVRITNELIAARRRVERDLISARDRLAAEERALRRMAVRRRAADALAGFVERTNATFKAIGDRSVATSPAADAGPLRTGTATIEVLMPDAAARLDVKGEVDERDADEWHGPRRVVRTLPMRGAAAYRVAASWMDAFGIPRTRTCELRVGPDGRYEVDLRGEEPSARRIDRK